MKNIQRADESVDIINNPEFVEASDAGCCKHIVYIYCYEDKLSIIMGIVIQHIQMQIIATSNILLTRSSMRNFKKLGKKVDKNTEKKVNKVPQIIRANKNDKPSIKIF